MSPRRKLKNKENKLPLTTKADPEKSSTMLATAESLFEATEFSAASKACDKSLMFDPSNIAAMELKANILVELNDMKKAETFLDKAISLSPSVGYNKYLVRAQICIGNDSIHFYNKGIEIIKKEIADLMKIIKEESPPEDTEMEVDEEPKTSKSIDELETNSDKLECLRNELSTVFCNIAELYMTDLCYEDDAQELCEAAIHNATESKPDNPEPHVLKARLAIILGKNKEATESIIKSTTLWFPKLHEIPADALLNSSARLNTAKVLIELSQHSEAEVVLHTLLEENNQTVEFWYLLGWNKFLEGEHSKEEAKEYLIKTKKVDHRFPCEDEDLLAHVSELLTTLGVKEDDIDLEADSDDEEEEEGDEKELEEELEREDSNSPQ